MNPANHIAVLSAALFLIGCVERTAYETPDESDQVGKLLLDKMPGAIQHRLAANLDEKVILHGYELDVTSAKPGGTLTVVWYWECREPPGPGWRLFTHMLDDQGRSRVNQDRVGPIREHFQPEHWRVGLVIKDIQSIKIPEKWSADAIELRVGLWKGGERMKVVAGPVDAQGRVKGPRIPCDAAKPIAAQIPRASVPPVIDGVFADEPAWASAKSLGKFADTITGIDVARATEVWLMWDDEHLYIAMKAEDDHLQSKFIEHDAELWHEDAFEIFLDPRGDKKHYYEIQTNPAGVVFDSYLRAYRKNRNAWNSNAKIAAKVDGTLNEPSTADRGWSAELAVPFAALTEGGGVPPAPGDVWRVNFFRVDVTQGKPVYSSWSPPLRGDFHALDRFGAVTFSAPPSPPSEAKDAGTPADASAAAGVQTTTGPGPGASQDQGEATK